MASKRADREAERRRTILRAAVEVFSRKGYHGCRMSDVAREAQVAYGLVYHYFKNKDELLQSVFSIGWARFLYRIQERISAAETLEARITGIITVAFEALKRDPRGVRVLILEVGRSPSASAALSRGEAFTSVLELAASLFRQAQVSGELSADVDPVLMASQLFGAVEMSLTACVLKMVDSSTPEALERVRDQVIHAVLRGVMVRRASPGDPTWQETKSSSPATLVPRG